MIQFNKDAAYPKTDYQNSYEQLFLKNQVLWVYRLKAKFN